MVFFLKLTTVPLGTLGVLASAATVVTLPVPVWTGTLADRFGALPLVVAAQLMQAIGYLAFSWAKTPAGIFAASALVAIGVRVFWSSIFTAIADYADARPGQRNKDSWYALANTARTAGLAAGGLAAGPSSPMARPARTWPSPTARRAASRSRPRLSRCSSGRHESAAMTARPGRATRSCSPTARSSCLSRSIPSSRWRA
jgi:MFS family permease